MAGKGGGAWKVAYADFVTAMMAFFMVMWITAQNNAVKQAIAQYFQDPMANSLRSTGGPIMLPTNDKTQPAGPSMLPSNQTGSAVGVDRSRLRWRDGTGAGNKVCDESTDKALPDANSKKSCLFIVHNGDRRYMGTMVLFPEKSVELDETAKERLMQLVEEVRGKPQKIEIRGHAIRKSRSPEDSEKDPWQTSYSRCQAVMRFLVGEGIEPERIRLSQGGAYEPYSLQADPYLQTYNSRVEVYVLNEFAENLMGTQEERDKRYGHP
jgi:chemotaxis protein MotB